MKAKKGFEWATKIYTFNGIVSAISGGEFILVPVPEVPVVIKVEALKGIGVGELVAGDLVRVTGNVVGIQKPHRGEANPERRQVRVLGHYITRALESKKWGTNIKEEIRSDFQKIYDDVVKIKFNNGTLE